MTTVASFTSLQAPLAEDSMEMSSPAQPVYDDDDIEIDFDEHIVGVEHTDDERMVDDIEQPRPGTATDDMMEDDAPSNDAQAPEQEMQDGFDAIAYEQVYPDDELIDYGEDDYQDMGESNDHTVYEPPAPEITLEDCEPTDPGVEQVDEEVIREPEISVPVPEVVVTEETNSETVPAVPETDATEASVVPFTEEPVADALNDATEQQAVASEHEDVVDVAAAADDQQAVASEHDDVVDVAAAADDQHVEANNPATPQDVEPFPELPEDSPEFKDVAPIPAPLDTNLDASVDAPATPTDTGLHPMVIQYGDWEWPLFKSKKQSEGLLKDDNLASVALADLLNNCRSRLALKVGEDISEDQEFVLRFDSTGLTIIENSQSAFSTSLEEVLEVFKQLHVNDGAQSIPPFWLYLSLQPKPSSYLTMLKQAAAGGQGISSFVDVPAEEVPADFGNYYQDGDEDPTLLGDASGIDYEGQPYTEGEDVAAEEEPNEADYHEYDTTYENTEGGQETEESYEQYEQYDEAEQADYEDYGEGEEADTPATHVQGEDNVQLLVHAAGSTQTDAQEAENVATDSAHEAIGESAVNAGRGEGEEQGEGSNVESVASSTTLRADQAKDAAGECKDEDLVDWNDSTLTRYHSELGTDDNDNFSTFFTEPDLEETEPQADTGDTKSDHVTGAADQEAAGPGHDLEQANVHEPAPDAGEHESETDGRSHSQEELYASPKTVEDQASDLIDIGDLQSQSRDKTDAHAEPKGGKAPKLDAPPHTTAPPSGHEPEHQAEPLTATEPTRNNEDYIDFGDEDSIDFDDDTYEQHEARKASLNYTSGSQSPNSKRPLDEIDGIDLTEEPDLKKVRSS